MPELKNSDVLGGMLRSVFEVSSRRTTQGFSAKVMGAIIKTLEQKYDFLKYVYIEETDFSNSSSVVNISPDLNSIDHIRIGKAIEAVIRVVYMDMIGKAGLFFINEVKKQAGEKLISELKIYGVDLSLLQIEQHYLYRKRKRRKTQSASKGGVQYSGVSLLGYTWNNVSSWKYDPNRKTCTLYSKEGKVLDQLNLDTIIENYVKNLSESLEEYDELPTEYQTDLKISEKEYELLKMLHSRDMDADTAMTLLHISKEEFQTMIHKLLEVEMLHYVSYNVIELTEIGLNYLSKKEKAKEEQIST